MRIVLINSLIFFLSQNIIETSPVKEASETLRCPIPERCNQEKRKFLSVWKKQIYGPGKPLISNKKGQDISKKLLQPHPTAFSVVKKRPVNQINRASSSQIPLQNQIRNAAPRALAEQEVKKRALGGKAALIDTDLRLGLGKGSQIVQEHRDPRLVIPKLDRTSINIDSPSQNVLKNKVTSKWAFPNVGTHLSGWSIRNLLRNSILERQQKQEISYSGSPVGNLTSGFSSTWEPNQPRRS